MQGVGV